MRPGHTLAELGTQTVMKFPYAGPDPPGSVRVSLAYSVWQQLSRASSRERSFPAPPAWSFQVEMLLGIEPGAFCVSSCCSATDQGHKKEEGPRIQCASGVVVIGNREAVVNGC